MIGRSTWFRHQALMTGELPSTPPLSASGAIEPDDDAVSDGGSSESGSLSPIHAGSTYPSDGGSSSSGRSSSGQSSSSNGGSSSSSSPSSFFLPDGSGAGGTGEGGDAVAVLRDLEGLKANGVCITERAFLWGVDDFVGFTFATNHGLSRAAVADYLKQRGSRRHYNTPYLIGHYIEQCVRVVSVPVPCCPNGCMAFPHRSEDVTTCPHCDANLFKGEHAPALTTPYWPIIPWLRLVLKDEIMSSYIKQTMAHARECAAAPWQQYRDFYDSATFRDLCRRKVITSDYDIMLGAAVDGYDAYEQTGAKGVIISVMMLSLPADMRSKLVCMLPVLITPGPGEPVDLDSFIVPLMTELDSLAAGVEGVEVHGEDEPIKLRAMLLHTSTDMVGGDKLIHMTGHSGRVPGRLRLFHGVVSGSKYYYPPKDPTTKEELFSVTSPSSNLRPRGSLRRHADHVEAMRMMGRPDAHVQAEIRRTGVSGWSPLLNPGPDTRAAFPSLSYFWALGPAATAPYDTMHLFFCNVVPNLWGLLSGKLRAGTDVVDDYLLSAAVRAEMGKQYKAAARTVPVRQARSMRNIDKHSGSFKAVDWMFFLLSGAEALLYGRVPEYFYQMIMCLCRAGRLLFTPDPISKANLLKADDELKKFLSAYYAEVYRGELSRVRLCRYVFSALLDVVPNVKQCGPVWCTWQFPLERLIGTLPGMVRSRSRPHASLVNAISKRHSSELILAFANGKCPAEWAAAIGADAVVAEVDADAQDGGGPGDNCNVNDGDGGGSAEDSGSYGRRWRLPLPSEEDCAVILLPPVSGASELDGEQLTALQQFDATLADANPTPIKFFRVLLRNKAIVDARDNQPHMRAARRRTSLLRVQSSDRRLLRGGRVETFERRTYGVVEHFLLCDRPGGVTALAFLRLVCSRQDPAGRYGIPDEVRGMDVFTSYDGMRRYTDVMSILDSVGCLTREGRHHVLFTREPFSIIGAGESA